MTRLLPLLWSCFGASILAAAVFAPPFFVAAFVLAVIGAIIENES